MPDTNVSREEVTAHLEAMRSEITAGLTTAGVQIGAVEKTLIEKINGVKLWGALALIGGQTVAALLSQIAGGSIFSPARAAAHAVSVFLS
jgi:hypothetical protein